MCLIFLAVNQHPRYKLIVAGNRDEFYARRTAAAHFWEDHPGLLAGRDLEAMGTWLGMNRAGKISMLTNFRDLSNIKAAAPSRGKLVSDFLINDESPESYIRTVAAQGASYNGFNLINGTAHDLWYYSNYGAGPVRLQNGLYGISNHLLDTPWPKIVRGKEKMKAVLTEPHPDPEEMFRILYDEEVAQDQDLPHTGLTIDRERALSAMFIKTNGYGSRCTTVIMIDHDDDVVFKERVFDTTSFTFETNTFNFRIANAQQS